MRKKLMTLALALMGMVMLCTAAHAGNDKPIDVSRLPQTAQQTIKTHFKSHKVAMAKVDAGLLEKSYEVVFNNGDKVEFDRDGDWTDIKCKRSGVPKALVPEAIRSYVKKMYHSARILEIEKERSGYEIKLSNGLDIKFDRKFRVTDIDD